MTVVYVEMGVSYCRAQCTHCVIVHSIEIAVDFKFAAELKQKQICLIVCMCVFDFLFLYKLKH